METLRELLQKNRQSKSVYYIGSRTGFVLIGTPAYCLDHLTSVSIGLLEDLKKSRESCEKECASLREKLRLAKVRYADIGKAMAKAQSDYDQMQEAIAGPVSKEEKEVFERTRNDLIQTIRDLKAEEPLAYEQVSFHKDMLSKTMMRGHRIDKRILDFQYLNDRLVTETYDRIQYDEPGMNVIVEGEEEGKYWSLKEWKEVHTHIRKERK